MKQLILILTIILLAVQISFGQKEHVSRRYKTDKLAGIYIPKDLDDCFKQIDSLLSDSTKMQIKLIAENRFVFSVPNLLELWIINNWQLWSGSRLTYYFNKLGINHPHDMSSIILKSYYRQLTQKDIKLDEQIKECRDFAESMKKETEEQTVKEFSKYHIGDTVTYMYHKWFVSEKQMISYYEKTCIAKGIITKKNIEYFFIKVLLIESCDKKGINYRKYKHLLSHKRETDRYKKRRKAKNKRMKVSQQDWFYYIDWQKTNE